MSATLKISKGKLKQGSVIDILRFAYCADTENFHNHFKSIGIDINDDEDLKALAKLHSQGKDLDGTMGTKFDLMKFIGGMKIRHNKLNNCAIRLID